jgi:isopentenyldiphosphate isomerase
MSMPGEDYLKAAIRETAEEVGITDINLTWIGKYYYERRKGHLTMRRFNGIFTGLTTQVPTLDPTEVAQVKWINQAELRARIAQQPSDFTTSLKEIIDRFSNNIFNENPSR